MDRGRYRVAVLNADTDLAAKCAAWIVEHAGAWQLANADNAVFSSEEWRRYAAKANGNGLTAEIQRLNKSL
jgi:hypothetical protein